MISHSILTGLNLWVRHAIFGVRPRFLAEFHCRLMTRSERTVRVFLQLWVGVRSEFGSVELLYLSGEGFLVPPSCDLVGDDSIGVYRSEVLFP